MSSSRTGSSSHISRSATSATFSRQYLMPAIGALMGRVSRRRSTLDPGAPLQLQTDGHEVIRRPGAGVRELQLSLVAAADLLDLLVEHLGLVALDEERTVEDHAVADDLVRARRDR